jgi:hypothetical protein
MLDPDGSSSSLGSRPLLSIWLARLLRR